MEARGLGIQDQFRKSEASLRSEYVMKFQVHVQLDLSVWQLCPFCLPPSHPVTPFLVVGCGLPPPCFSRQLSLCISDCPGTSFVNQAGLELKECTTTHNWQ